VLSELCMARRELESQPLAEDPWNTGTTAGNSPVGESGWPPELVPE
jgi:hypothetical protein